jgi:hypothetical protein
MQTIFGKSNKVKNSNELDIKEKQKEKIRNQKSDIINTICDFKSLNKTQLNNIKNQSANSLIEILIYFNNNQEYCKELIEERYLDDSEKTNKN